VSTTAPPWSPGVIFGGGSMALSPPPPHAAKAALANKAEPWASRWAGIDSVFSSLFVVITVPGKPWRLYLNAFNASMEMP
jgi:hypothetical protein